MRVLVTGGGGFIGSHLVDALLARGDEPVVLDDWSGGSRDNLPPGVETLDMDVADPRTVSAIAALRPDGIIHGAAQVSVPRSMADPDRDRAVNVVGTAHVLAGAREAGSPRVVFLSTGGGIYGESDGADEMTLPQPKSYYSAHKYLAERYLEYSGLPYAIARLANVYGPRQRSDLEGGVVAIFTERLSAGQPITIYGSGEQYRDFVYVADVVDAVLTMLDSSVDGMWNVATGEATTVNALLAALQERLGSTSAIVHEPPRPGDVFASRLSIDRIKADLGWSPRYDLAAGLDAMLK
ncbi:NAD-dependent epimerase/dehydratase family protein [Sphaerobacter thermophilus]|uniref:NAD-dependent epimerase/dehydratase family protein n=1 Tax=Sphaerobacter thermophilus TaxID=2057 RepID=UPI0039C17C61